MKKYLVSKVDDKFVPKTFYKTKDLHQTQLEKMFINHIPHSSIHKTHF